MNVFFQYKFNGASATILFLFLVLFGTKLFFMICFETVPTLYIQKKISCIVWYKIIFYDWF